MSRWRVFVGGMLIILNAGCIGDLSSDVLAPVIQIDSPLEGETVSGVVNITVGVGDDTGIDFVRFFAGGQVLGEDEIPPFSWLWDTTTAPDGPIVVEAEVRDLANNFARARINVVVANTPAP